MVVFGLRLTTRIRGENEGRRTAQPQVSPCPEGIGKVKEPIWLNREDCLAIHEMMLAQHGGLTGVRDEGLLESALSKPQNLFTYSSPTLPEMAASYAAGMILNHPVSGWKQADGVYARRYVPGIEWHGVYRDGRIRDRDDISPRQRETEAGGVCHMAECELRQGLVHSLFSIPHSTLK